MTRTYTPRSKFTGKEPASEVAEKINRELKRIARSQTGKTVTEIVVGGGGVGGGAASTVTVVQEASWSRTFLLMGA